MGIWRGEEESWELLPVDVPDLSLLCDLVLSRFQNSLKVSGLVPSWHAGRILKHLGLISRKSPST